MKEYIKKYFNNILIVFGYIVVASLVYGVLFHALWGKWYLDLLIIGVVIGLGVLIGYFYIKGIEKENEAKKITEPDTVEPDTETKVEENDPSLEIKEENQEAEIKPEVEETAKEKAENETEKDE